MIKIDKNIPAPKIYKYPFDKLEIGDSFFVKMEPYSKSLHSGICTMGRKWFNENKPEGKITTRKIDNGIRVWRIK